ncbi:MAG: 50S ribosomal protein L21e [Nanoarchaeota archaeon]|nr:50S ribosomal protein L21e [Nanoarchaeota archaeon]
MVTRSHGFRVGTRRKLRKKVRERGKVKIGAALQEFDINEKVIIDVEPSYHKGMPHRRFIGKHGKIVEKKGKSYIVEVRDGGKYKKIICAPIHLRKA